jgi:hypothetical protein
MANKLFDQLVPKAGNASKVAAVLTYLTDSHPWIVHFELFPNHKDPGSIDVFSHTSLDDVVKRLSL